MWCLGLLEWSLIPDSRQTLSFLKFFSLWLEFSVFHAYSLTHPISPLQCLECSPLLITVCTESLPRTVHNREGRTEQLFVSFAGESEGQPLCKQCTHRMPQTMAWGWGDGVEVCAWKRQPRQHETSLLTSAQWSSDVCSARACLASRPLSG